MAAASWFKYSYLAYLSSPKADRQLYRLLKRQQIVRIVEVGIRDIARTLNLIEVAQRFAADRKVAYTGLDWFDARTLEQSPLTLKQAHASLHATAVQIRLVPGSPSRSLTSVANAHPNTELLLIADWVTDDELQAAWFYVPRMLRANSLVLRERLGADGQLSVSALTIAELATLAERAARRRAA